MKKNSHRKDNSISNDSISNNSIPSDSISNDSIPNVSISSDSISSDSVSNELISSDSISNDSISNDSISNASVSKNSSPKVSIIIPLYNAEKYINTCIESILEQTFKDFELIIIDDCSTDGSYEIAKKYDDPRIKLIQQEKNSGDAATRNLGIKTACGEYIYFVDDDDALMTNIVEIFLNAAEESGADLVITNQRFETPDADFVFGSKVKIKRIACRNPNPRFFSDDINERILHEYLPRNTHWEPWMKFQRRDFMIEHNILFPITWCTTDRLFYLSQLCFAKKVQMINCCGYVYRRHPNQTVQSSIDKALSESLRSMPQAVEFINKLFSKLDLTPEQINTLAIKSMIEYFEITVALSYRRVNSQEHVNEVLSESILEKGMLEPEFVMAMFNMLANQIIENDHYKQAILNVRQDLNNQWNNALQQTIRQMNGVV